MKSEKNMAAELVPMSPLLAAVTVARLELTRVIRGRALRAAAIVVALLAVVATVSCFVGDGDARATFVGTMRGLFPWLAMGLSLLFAARAVSDDIEAGILHYFYLLPTPRYAVTLGKYICAASVVTGLLVGGAILLYIGTHLAEPGLIIDDLLDLLYGCAAAAGAGLSYTAIFLFLGSAVADLPYLLPLLFVAIFEVGLGSLPVLEVASVRHHVNVMLGVHNQAAAEGVVDSVLEQLGLVTPVVDTWVAVVVVVSVFVVFLALSLVVTEYSEYRTGKP